MVSYALGSIAMTRRQVTAHKPQDLFRTQSNHNKVGSGEFADCSFKVVRDQNSFQKLNLPSPQITDVWVFLNWSDDQVLFVSFPVRGEIAPGEQPLNKMSVFNSY
jgi:hypothetical protein